MSDPAVTMRIERTRVSKEMRKKFGVCAALEHGERCACVRLVVDTEEKPTVGNAISYDG